jgi:hypothetical protein
MIDLFRFTRDARTTSEIIRVRSERIRKRNLAAIKADFEFLESKRKNNLGSFVPLKKIVKTKSKVSNIVKNGEINIVTVQTNLDFKKSK